MKKRICSILFIVFCRFKKNIHIQNKTIKFKNFLNKFTNDYNKNMKEDSKKILQEFENNKELYNRFTNKCKNLIIDLLIDENINYHQIAERIKEKNKLEEKISRKDYKYTDIQEITDICGIRIISFFEDEVDKIAKVIKNTFDIDPVNSIDKRQLESDRFGYRSLHYVASFKNERLKLPEYKKFKS